jgi:hypothetical protein
VQGLVALILLVLILVAALLLVRFSMRLYGSVVNPVAMFCAIYCLAYVGRPLYLLMYEPDDRRLQFVDLNWSMAADMALFSLLALLAFSLSFYLFSSSGRPGVTRKVMFGDSFLFTVGLVLFILGLSFFVVWLDNQGGLSQAVLNTRLKLAKAVGSYHMVGFAHLMVIGLMIIPWPRPGLLHLVIVLSASLLLSMSFGYRELFIIDMAILFSFYLYAKRVRFNAVKAALLVAVLVFVSLGFSTLRSGDTGDKAGFQALSHNALDKVMRDFNFYDTNINVIDAVGSKDLDLYHGRSYLVDLPLMLVPRSLWPSKPKLLGNQYLNSMLYPDVTSSIFPPGLVGEAHWNLGLAGFVVLCFWGAVCAYELRAFNVNRENLLFSIFHGVFIGVQVRLVKGGIFGVSHWGFLLLVPLLVLFLLFRKNPFSTRQKAIHDHP